MREEEINKIVQKSLLKNSDSFMDDLMDKIEVKERMEEPFVWPIKITLSVISAILLLISFTLYKSWHLSNDLLYTGISVSKTAILLIVSLIFLSTINHILKLHEEYRLKK